MERERQKRTRYARQLDLIGKEGQSELEKTSVAVVGLGGLGSPASIYLCAAGIGQLVLIDPQQVEASNLNRQILYDAEDEGKDKVELARQNLLKLNPELEVQAFKEKIERGNVDRLQGVDLVVDALDNYAGRYLLNSFCVKNGVPLVHGAVEGFRGQITTVIPGEGPCLRCIFPTEPAISATPAVLGATAGLIGTNMALEVIKVILDLGENLKSKLALFDLQFNDFQTLQIKRDENCPVCGGNR